MRIDRGADPLVNAPAHRSISPGSNGIDAPLRERQIFA
jgi:hypothetical protein